MKARWLTLFACVPIIAGTMLLMSCGGVGGPTGSTSSTGSNTATQNFLAILTPAQKTATYIGADACGQAACHGGAPATTAAHLASMTRSATSTGQYATWKLTAHFQNGVTCESCHGPGSAHAAKPTNTDGTTNAILTFPNLGQPAVCGQCHGPTHDQWAASSHAQLISSPISSTVTSPASSGQSSRCFLCHGGQTRGEYTENGIDPSAMTLTQITNVANDILNTVPYSASCITCHDPMAKKGNLNAKGVDVQIYHPESLSDATAIAPNTTAAQYTAANQICGQCHNGRGTTATDAYLTANTSRPSVHHSNQFNSLLGVGGVEDAAGPPQRTTTHASAPGQCATCHMGNASHTMTVQTDSGCQPCHTSADASNRAASLKGEIVNGLTALSTSLQNWAVATKGLGDAEDWDYTSNITDGAKAPAQTLIPIQVKRARHNYYYIVTSGDYGVHNAAYTRYLLQVANENLVAAGIPVVSPSAVMQVPMSKKLATIVQARANVMKSTED